MKYSINVTKSLQCLTILRVDLQHLFKVSKGTSIVSQLQLYLSQSIVRQHKFLRLTAFLNRGHVIPTGFFIVTLAMIRSSQVIVGMSLCWSMICYSQGSLCQLLN
uniref:Uncharacterized protein n=1 Tax=Opuntia streptacantha TaxID=393608 RepID=A0A7C9B4V9_OPUST